MGEGSHVLDLLVGVEEDAVPPDDILYVHVPIPRVVVPRAPLVAGVVPCLERGSRHWNTR